MNVHSTVWRSISRLQYLYPNEVNQICQRIGISPSLLAGHNLTLPLTLFLNFFIEAEDIFDDDLFSIKYARMAQIRPNYSEILGMISLYSPNLIESFNLVNSYINLELDGIDISLIQKTNVVDIRFVANAAIEHASLYENLCMSIFATFIKSLHHPIDKLTTKTTTKQATNVVRSLFHCPIQFKANHTAIILTNEVSLKQNPTANPKLISLLEIMAKEKITQKANEGNIVNRLEDIYNSYEDRYSNINITETSNLLGLSINTLRRELSKRKTTFRQTLNNFKLKKAKSMLASNYSVKRVAYSLGYTEPSAFVRWFINQAKQTPKEYKKEVTRQ
ncbi:MAG TPA: AraC family transcriptional regulator [Gammaproteobacteria bacterium]|jgi:AraC-like DNA-binding protein|nr:AraC family transcriptional regulator [Gammaproteobacteria bacterium]|tara:strand:- start:5775 stop:6773 length:999 start_codon:yes stop_codon:yes gene_type:complete